MRRVLTALVLVLTLAGAARSAAPPAAYRPLTTAERQQAAALARRAQMIGLQGQFEEAQRLAGRVLGLCQGAQGRWHWEAASAREVVERWQWLTRVPREQRPDLRRALRLPEEASTLRAKGRFREAER